MASSSTQRASVWSLTIANPTAEHEEQIGTARQRSGWSVTGQKEKAEGGLVHYQLLLKTPQVRFSAVKKQFPTAHIEVARNQAALEKYVHKEDTRVSVLPASSEKYPSLSKFWDLIYDLANEWNWIDFTDGKPCGFRPRHSDGGRMKNLFILDKLCYELICRGYYVESVACNPSTRAQFNAYGIALMIRQYEVQYEAERLPPVADSQTDSHSVDFAQDIIVPTINASDDAERIQEDGSEASGSDDETEDTEAEGGSDSGSDCSDQESDCA